jgi:hypothetical protein
MAAAVAACVPKVRIAIRIGCTSAGGDHHVD